MKSINLKPSQCLLIAICTVVLCTAIRLHAGTFLEIKNFGTNYSNAGMFLYIPAKLASKPPILVCPHACGGTASSAYGNGGGFAKLAETYGYLVIYPEAHTSTKCWDVHSPEALTHNGGGDSRSIVSMVQYVIKTYHADSTRVFVSGHSSGGMMTNVLCGAYPDVFKGGAPFAGVPFSCFAGSTNWCSDCAQGKIKKTGAQWGDLVRAAYPGYTGLRPRMQLWHGTEDATLVFTNFGEEIKQWTNVLGVSEIPTSTDNNTPRNTWIRTRYSNPNSKIIMVEAIQETAQPHNLQLVQDSVVKFFGLDRAATSVNNEMIDKSPKQQSFVKTTLSKVRDAWIVQVSSNPGFMSIDLCDIAGKKIQSVASEVFSTGHISITLNGKNSENGQLPCGVYIVSVKMHGMSFQNSRLMVTAKN